MRTHFELSPSQGGRVTITSDIETGLITIDAFNSALDAQELAIFVTQLDLAKSLLDLAESLFVLTNDTASKPTGSTRELEDKTVYDEPCLPEF